MSEIKHGLLKSYDATAKTASVQIVGGLNEYLNNVPVDQGLAAAQAAHSGVMTAGRFVAVLFPEEGNPANAVVFTVWV